MRKSSNYTRSGSKRAVSLSATLSVDCLEIPDFQSSVRGPFLRA